MQVRSIHFDEIESARVLLEANSLGPRVEDAAIFQDLVERSQVELVAIVDGIVVGFLPAISDELFNDYISMVVVAEEYRGRGIGTRLVRAADGASGKRR